MANEKLKTYCRSYIDRDLDGYTLSGDYVTPANVTDRCKTTFAITSGLGTDGDNADFIADMGTARTIDTIMLKSNLKTFTVYYWDGAAWQTKEAVASNASGFLVMTFTPFSTTKIKIAATHTIVASEEKKIYLLEICAALYELQPQKVEVTEAYQTAGFENVLGGAVSIVKYPNHAKVNMRLQFDHLAGADFTAYQALKRYRRIDNYTVWAYFSEDDDLLGPEAWYLVTDASDFKASPSEYHTAAGYNGEMELREC